MRSTARRPRRRRRCWRRCRSGRSPSAVRITNCPSRLEEIQIMKMATGVGGDKPQAVLTEAEILSLQQVVRRMAVAEHVYAYAEKLVRVTRPKAEGAMEFCKKWLTWGAGPRAGL